MLRPISDLRRHLMRYRVPLRDEVAEGLLLLDYALRMRLKNRVVVDILTADGAVDPAAWVTAAHAEFDRSIREAEASRARLGRLVRRFRVGLGSAEHMHDYGAADLFNLLRRRRLLRLTVVELQRWQEDNDRVVDLIGRARHDALDEIGQAIRQVLPTNGSTEDDQILRARLLMLETVDLPDLARQMAPRRDAHGRHT